MHGPPDTPGRRHLLTGLIVTSLLLSPSSARAQSSQASPLAAPVVHSVVPSRITSGHANPVGHLHLMGTFPEPSYRLLSRLAVWVYGGSHSCRLGWSSEPIGALLTASGQPWLSVEDLIDEAENRARRECGTIDAVWAHRLEISILHPRLLLPGVLRVGVALYPKPSFGMEAVGTPAESWIQVPVVPPFRIVARTPRAPVVRRGELLRLSFAITGGPPIEVTLDRGRDEVPLAFEVEGSRVGVSIPPELYVAPVVVRIRLSTATESLEVGVPICFGGVGAAVACPPP